MAIKGPLDRRTFLYGSGVSMALPMLDAMVPAAAAAGGSTVQLAPMRLTTTVIPWGFSEANFRRYRGIRYKGAGPLESIEPLKAHIKDYAIFSGLDHGQKGGHDAMHTVLTGVHNRGPYKEDAEAHPNGVLSLDQRAAEHVGYATRFPSINLWSGRGHSWSRYRVPIPNLRRGVEGFYRTLFTNKTTPAQRKAQAKNMLARNSILDLVQSDANSLQRKLGAQDRKKLDEYFTAVRETERRIQAKVDWLTKPTPKVDYTVQGGRLNIAEQYPIWYDLMFLALQTDQTRVVTLGIPGGGWESLAGVTSGNQHGLGHDRKDDQLKEIDKFQLGQLARFFDKLKETKDLDGKPMFDSTINLLVGSMQDSGRRHGTRNLPVVLAGGGFRARGHVQMPYGTPLNNLYLSILRRFGPAELEAFNTSTGPIRGLRATRRA
jgi:hypothetical protein